MVDTNQDTVLEKTFGGLGLLELVSRALCVADGVDPGDTNQENAPWLVYKKKAQKAIEDKEPIALEWIECLEVSGELAQVTNNTIA